MAVVVLSSQFVNGGVSRVGVSTGELQVAQRDRGIESGHDECSPQRVLVDPVEPGSCADRADAAVGGAGVEPAAIVADEDRSVRWSIAGGRHSHLLRAECKLDGEPPSRGRRGARPDRRCPCSTRAEGGCFRHSAEAHFVVGTRLHPLGWAWSDLGERSATGIRCESGAVLATVTGEPSLTEATGPMVWEGEGWW
jgi:hypothetical protein